MGTLLKLTAKGRKVTTSLEEAPGLSFSLSRGCFSTNTDFGTFPVLVLVSLVDEALGRDGFRFRFDVQGAVIRGGNIFRMRKRCQGVQKNAGRRKAERGEIHARVRAEESYAHDSLPPLLMSMHPKIC